MVGNPEAVWVEKYRPTSLSAMVGQESVVPLLKAFAAQKSLPHLLFAGPPGTGKTTAALCLARDLYGDEWRQSFLELNASDERGIETVRTTIKGYARTSAMGAVGFKLLFLDEADNLTQEAQASLRRLMERYSGGCRFILSCNYSSKIIEPIQSRTAVFRFRVMTPDQMRDRLAWIAHQEGRVVEPEALAAILSAGAGDLRRATNLLQLACAYANPVTEATVRDVATTPLKTEIESLLTTAVSGKFPEARSQLYRLFTERGASGEDILRAMHTYLPDLPDRLLAPEEKIRLIEYLGEIDFRLAQGAGERIQMESVLARLALSRAGRR